MGSGNDSHRKECFRYNVPGHAHGLTFSCYKRQPLLTGERTCQYLADAIIKAGNAHGFSVLSYVFMPEHVHLLIWPKCEEYSIPDILSSIKQSVSRRELQYLRRNRPEKLVCLSTGQKHTPYRFWQDGGGYDRNIKDESTLMHVVEYTHNNPGGRGLVELPLEWKWSSARFWSDGSEDIIPIDRKSFNP
jgi:putative transposase